MATAYEDGVVAHQRGDYAIAVRIWRPLAEQGDAEAQCSLGFMYANGRGVPQDYVAAANWYRKAADQGHAGAQFNLGLISDKDQVGPQIDAALSQEKYEKPMEQSKAGGTRTPPPPAVQTLKNIGAVLAGIAGVVALVFLMALYIEGLAWVSNAVHEYLSIAATIALAVCVIVFLPCALFRATRKVSVYGLFISSAIFGASTWVLGFLVTLHYWGAWGVFVGVVMGVVGIVPLGMLASAFHSDLAAVGQLALGLVLTFGARMIAVMLAAWTDRNEAGIASPSGSTAPILSRRTLVVTACMLGLGLLGSVSVWLADTDFDPDAYLSSARAVGSFETASVALNKGDYPTALPLMHRLADQGLAAAQNSLGFMYDLGKGVPRDEAEAVKWYRLAAGKGDATAQYNLGSMYNKGRGVPQDYVRAHMWFNLAAAQGDDDAAKWRDNVGMLMTPAQIAEAQKLAREWKPTR